jgi:hypothetical protein
MKLTKYVNTLILQGNYGYGDGWEDEGAYLANREGWKEAREDRKAYRENSPGAVRIIKRRVLRADYESGNF